jgi:hypothetical protein
MSFAAGDTSARFDGEYNPEADRGTQGTHHGGATPRQHVGSIRVELDRRARLPFSTGGFVAGAGGRLLFLRHGLDASAMKAI